MKKVIKINEENIKELVAKQVKKAINEVDFDYNHGTKSVKVLRDLYNQILGFEESGEIPEAISRQLLQKCIEVKSAILNDIKKRDSKAQTAVDKNNYTNALLGIGY
jgi:hypothetical protein